jgi:phosphoenolpyruvate carboxylase
MDKPSNENRLREEVSALGWLLGDLIERLEGKATFAHVELARQAARDWRRGDERALAQLRRTVRDLPPRDSIAITRAFSAYFGLVNLAEKANRIRERRENASLGASFASAIQILADQGVDAHSAAQLLERIDITPVFTAHPTETVRRTMLKKEQRIAQALTGPGDIADLSVIEHEMGIAWQTDEHFAQPSVDDEVEHVLFFLTTVIYKVVPSLYARLEAALNHTYGHGAVALPTRMLRFASWVGGDMDGNPNVDASTIRDTLNHHRMRVLMLYEAELHELFEHLSHSQLYVTPSEVLTERLAQYTDAATEQDAAPPRYGQMPYRNYVWQLWRRIKATQNAGAACYTAPAQFIADLEVLQASLQGHGDTGGGLVLDLIRRVHTFGFHLATLDVRQDSAVHREAVAQALARADFPLLPASARLQVLHEALNAPIKVRPLASDPQARGTALERSLNVMRAIRECRASHGEAAIGGYIISMAENPDDVLAVLYLARAAGLCDDNMNVPLDVAPLFEIVDDLDRAGSTVTALLADPLYRQHVRSRGDQQLVMLGYSDSSKESGLAASRWSLHTAQEELVAALSASAIDDAVKLTLFHGRGGTVSRGGGKPRDGIMATPAGALDGRLRVTEQGEIIFQKYGVPDSARYSLENTLASVLERTAREHDDAQLPAAWRSAAQLIASRSRTHYRDTVYGDPQLVAYFRLATPIDIIERLRIGSRPPARRGGHGIENLRAIPWVFAWNQSRLIFSGWFGLSAGLDAAVDTYGIDQLREMAAQWPFFGNLLADTEMVLAKADMRIAARYAELAGELGARLFPLLEQQYLRTCELLCAINGCKELLEHDPDLQQTLRLRAPYVDPMSLMQVDLLARWRASGREDQQLELALTETVRGITRAMQNAG